MDDVAAVNDDVERHLRYAEGMLGDLRAFITNPCGFNEAETTSLCMDWDQWAHAHFPDLARARDRMTAHQADRFDALVLEVRKLRPSLSRHQLVMPDLPGDNGDSGTSRFR